MPGLTTRRGATTYYGGFLKDHDVPLPAGCAAGDWVIVAALVLASNYTVLLPGDVVVPSRGSNSMAHAASKKVLTALDISNGYLRLTHSQASTPLAAVIVAYSESAGFAAAGTDTTKTATGDSTVAAATPSDGTQDILVFSLIKHSGSSQVFLEDTPSTMLVAQNIQQGSGMPAIHVGVYKGTAAQRVSRWSIGSSNGVGFQVAVVPSPGTPPDPEPEPGPTVSWWDGTTEQNNATLHYWDGSAERDVARVD